MKRVMPMMSYFIEAQETLAVLSSKPPQYRTLSGETVTLDLSNAQQVILYPQGVVPEICTTPKGCNTNDVKVCLENVDTFTAAQQLVSSGKTAVLNFASAMHPGGGFLNGANAQEECLCRASTLYLSIGNKTAATMYNTNRNNDGTCYTDFMLFSPYVTVFRSIDGSFLETPYTCGVITAPAVNRIKAKGLSTEQIEKTMYSRCLKLLKIAVANNVENIILGAWGCGVFGNGPTEVATMFKRALFEESLAGYFKCIYFAVLDNRPEQPLYTAFKMQLQNLI